VSNRATPVCSLWGVTRRYELKKRAERQEETRQRIVEATVELHKTVGPARTTVSAIAERAGIERKTFYRHFPDPDTILEACSTHYRALNPPPDPHDWLAIDDPRERLRRGLLDVYGYYRRNEQMMANVLRDRELGVPVGDGFLRHRAAGKQILAQAFGVRGRRRLDAALELALDFRAWQTLARAGLSDRAVAELTSALVEAALPREHAY
jgi:AcrR family transcriptional regulator